jgi:hypothetical protein
MQLYTINHNVHAHRKLRYAAYSLLFFPCKACKRERASAIDFSLAASLFVYLKAVQKHEHNVPQTAAAGVRRNQLLKHAVDGSAQIAHDIKLAAARTRGGLG